MPLDPDIIRRIPFKLAEKGETFSMSRLSLKGKKKWAVAFQDPRFAGACRAYQRAVDNALELAIDGKMKDGAIVAVENAVADLEAVLQATPHLLDPEHQAEAAEARKQLDNLQKTHGSSCGCRSSRYSEKSTIIRAQPSMTSDCSCDATS